MIRVYFPKPRANLKFNPSHSMRLFFMEMLKYYSTIMVLNNKDDQQLQLNIEAILMNKTDFTKYFTVTQDIHPMNTKQATHNCWLPTHERSYSLGNQI